MTTYKIPSSTMGQKLDQTGPSKLQDSNNAYTPSPIKPILQNPIPNRAHLEISSSTLPTLHSHNVGLGIS